MRVFFLITLLLLVAIACAAPKNGKRKAGRLPQTKQARWEEKIGKSRLHPNNWSGLNPYRNPKLRKISDKVQNGMVKGVRKAQRKFRGKRKSKKGGKHKNNRKKQNKRRRPK